LHSVLNFLFTLIMFIYLNKVFAKCNNVKIHEKKRRLRLNIFANVCLKNHDNILISRNMPRRTFKIKTHVFSKKYFNNVFKTSYLKNSKWPRPWWRQPRSMVFSYVSLPTTPTNPTTFFVWNIFFLSFVHFKIFWYES